MFIITPESHESLLNQFKEKKNLAKFSKIEPFSFINKLRKKGLLVENITSHRHQASYTNRKINVRKEINSDEVIKLDLLITNNVFKTILEAEKASKKLNIKANYNVEVSLIDSIIRVFESYEGFNAFFENNFGNIDEYLEEKGKL